MTSTATAPVTAGAKLTPRQRRFVEEFVLDLNGRQAAIRAGYSVKTAEVQASRLLSLAKVREAVRLAKQERSRRTEVTQDYVLQRLCVEAEYTGPNAQHAARVRALELLARHLGMMPERHEHRHGGDRNAPPIDHQHTRTAGVLDLADLGLPKEVMRVILRAIRAKRDGVKPTSPPAPGGREFR